MKKQLIASFFLIRNALNHRQNECTMFTVNYIYMILVILLTINRHYNRCKDVHIKTSFPSLLFVRRDFLHLKIHPVKQAKYTNATFKSRV